MPKRNKNLSLEEEAIERGEIYSSMHNTNISALGERVPVAPPDRHQHRPRPHPRSCAMVRAAGGKLISTLGKGWKWGKRPLRRAPTSSPKCWCDAVL
jgi:hypothetical protein